MSIHSIHSIHQATSSTTPASQVPNTEKRGSDMQVWGSAVPDKLPTHLNHLPKPVISTMQCQRCTNLTL
ncbi:hypothetical protein BTUL_0013g00100 [Botrytis tulipae]|uniref:Uncharacterized protein n=1 Tax=Botrytis tulipae TaxID=87230 RepID=A0A4Z1F395_9HELO|nr:hypothetical protein BTUL_0013g00100 [Botrytis tulipae]